MSGLDHCPFAKEIMYELFENLSDDAGTLFNLLTLHSFYRGTLERLLYRDRVDWIFFPFPGTHTGFVTTISKNQRLASYVRSYAVIETSNPAGMVDSGGSDEYDESVRSFWRTVLKAVDNMSNLKVFVLQVLPLVGTCDLLPCSDLLATLSTKKLVTFKWNADSSAPNLLSFLTTQPQLKNLHIHVSKPLQKSNITFNAAQALPKLLHLSGNRDILEVLMPRSPGHSVSTLVWDRQTPIEIQLFHPMQTAQLASFEEPNLPESIHKIRSLTILNGVLPAVLQTTCRDLRCLQIQFSPKHTQQIMNAAFPLLECIIFTGVGSMQSISQAHLLSISSTSPSLIAIYAGPLKDSRPYERRIAQSRPRVADEQNNKSRNSRSAFKLNHGYEAGSVAPAALLPVSAFWSASAPRTIRTATSFSHTVIQGGTFIFGPSTTSTHFTFNVGDSPPPVTDERKKIDFPDINTFCTKVKYGCWSRKKIVDENWVEVNNVIVERSIFSDDLLHILWPAK